MNAALKEAKAVIGENTTEDEKEKKKEDDAVEDDLELPLQPSTLLMDSLLGDSTATTGGATEGMESNDKERVERTIVMPWMRFCWEAYKTCLDVTKSNARLEVLYNVSVHHMGKKIVIQYRLREF